jgi:hypothetical protein
MLNAEHIRSEIGALVWLMVRGGARSQASAALRRLELQSRARGPITLELGPEQPHPDPVPEPYPDPEIQLSDSANGKGKD